MILFDYLASSLSYLYLASAVNFLNSYKYMSLPIVAIIGRPNTGKSRLFNRLIGKKQAIVSDIAGTTRDRISTRMQIKDKEFLLVDTGGLEMPKTGSSIENDMYAQSMIAIQEADIILFLVDATLKLHPDDFLVLEKLRKAGTLNQKPVMLCLSKCDRPLRTEEKADFYQLGLEKIIEVSAVHKLGIQELESEIYQKLPKYEKQENNYDDNLPRVTFIGRPNTGKSSLVNAYLKSERFIIADEPGTTRDTQDTEIIYDGKSYVFIDTAGIRRRGKIEKGIEKWALSRTLEAMEKADICCLLIDAGIGPSSQDQHVLEQALLQKKGIVLVVNKWDLHEKGERARNDFLWQLKRKFQFIPWAPIIFLSAKNSAGLNQLFPCIDNVMEQRMIRIPTGKMNALVREAQKRNKPRGTKRQDPKIYYASQVDVNPPKFKFFVNKGENFHFSFFRFLENFIREKYGFWGTPLDFDIVDKD